MPVICNYCFKPHRQCRGMVQSGTSKAYICEKCVLNSFTLVKKRVFSVNQVLRACDLIEAHQKSV